MDGQGGPAPLPVPEITQVGLVVADLEATMAAYHRLLGWGPWNVYEYTAANLTELTVRGEPVEASYLGAETRAGPIGFELLQPLEGPTLYREWLDQHGEGFHHLGCMLPSREAAARLVASLGASGAEVIGSGRVGEDLEFFYLDTQPALKLVIETGGGHSQDTIDPVRVFP